MRIFIATGIFHPEPGGPATYLYRLIPELIAHGHTVRVLTFGEAQVSPTDYPYPVQRITRTGPAPLRYARYAHAARRLEAWCDLVYAHDLSIMLSGRRPHVYKVVGDAAWERAVNKGWLDPRTDIDAFQTTRYKPSVAWLKWMRARKVQHATRVIVPSAYLAHMVIGWGAPPDRVQVIYNALAPGPTLPDAASARAQLGLPADKTVFFTAARLAPWKGVDYLVEAMRSIEDAHLIVAGDGPQMPTLRASAGERVTLLGRITRDQVALYMRASDYVILYSGYEGLPHVLLEALEVGTPVIASAKGGNPEVVQHESNGLLVPWADKTALVETLQRVTDSPELRARLAEGVGAGLARFSWSRLVEQTLTALEAAYTGG